MSVNKFQEKKIYLNII